MNFLALLCLDRLPDSARTCLLDLPVSAQTSECMYCANVVEAHYVLNSTHYL
jgi:hypothetical protein